MKTIVHALHALLLSMLLAFAAPSPAHAQGIIYGDNIPSGVTVNQDVILTGQNVLIEGTVNGNVFILGNQVIINGDVDGSLVLVAQNAMITGRVSGTVYAATLTLELGPESELERDLYVMTVSLTSGKGAVIERDLYAVGLDAGLNGKVQRDLHTTIGPIQLYNGLMTILGFPDLTIRLHFESPQSNGGSLPAVGRHARIIQIAPSHIAFDWGEWSMDLLRSWSVLIVFTFLTFWLCRKWLDSAAQQIRTRFWKTLGIGLIVLVIAFTLFGVLAIIAVLIFALGLGLNSLGIWQITIVLYLAAFSILALSGVFLWFFIAYGARIIAIYTISIWLYGKLCRRKTLWLDLLAILVGTIVYMLLQAVPYAGWVFDVLMTAIGAGASWLAIHDWRQSARAAPLPASPVPQAGSKKKKK